MIVTDLKRGLKLFFCIFFSCMTVISIGSCTVNKKVSSGRHSPEYSPESQLKKIILFANKKKWDSLEVKYNITYTQTISKDYSLKHGGPPPVTEKAKTTGWSKITGGFQLQDIIILKKQKNGRMQIFSAELHFKDGTKAIKKFEMLPTADGGWRLLVPVPVTEH